MRLSTPVCAALLAGCLLPFPTATRADCSLTNLSLTPLPDLGFGRYQGFTGGLYPRGANQRPPEHQAEGLGLATEEILPRDGSGIVNTNDGKVVLLSIGMSNTTQEFSAFRQKALADPALHPRLVIVDGAQGGQASTDWTNVNAQPWSVVQQRLQNTGVTSNQVQVLWIKQAQRRPRDQGEFPLHARSLQQDLEHILRVARQRYPNLRMAFLSSRTRAYTDQPGGLNPEPYAYEAAFSTKWLIEKQLAGDLNHDPARGPAVVPWLSWGPYLWADGTAGRSDGFVWLCSDTRTDFTHPSDTGRTKVADQLLAFFKTDPAVTPWFLRPDGSSPGQPPAGAPTANATNGLHPLSVQFQANASDPDGAIRDYQWTFDDGTYATNADPVKTFTTPGDYRVHLTVTDAQGNTSRHTLSIQVQTEFSLWQLAKFTALEQADPAVSGPRSDPDSDGIPNDWEYLLGLEPKETNGPGTGLPSAFMEDGHWTYEFTRFPAAADWLAVPLLSTDLLQWETGSPGLEVMAMRDEGPVHRLRVRQAAPAGTAGRGFLHLRVEPRER